MTTLLMFAALGCWQAAAPTPYWAGLTVKDAQASAEWYRDRLGFEIFDRMSFVKQGVEIRFLKLRDFHLELVQRSDSFAVAERIAEDFQPSQVRGYFKLGFRVADIDRLVDDLRQQGVVLFGEIFDDERFGARMVLIKDPDGNLIQLFEPKPDNAD